MKDKNPKVLKSEDLKEPWVEAFKTGPVKDMAGNEHNFSEADLADLNEGIHGQLDAGYQPPMVKGHPEVDSPRVASIVDSKVDGNVLKVKLDKMSNDDIKELEALIGTKNAVLCKIQKIIPALGLTPITGSQQIHSIDDILNRDPLDTLKETFAVKHNAEMSEHQEQMLKQLLESID